MAVIAGTGSVAFARAADGRYVMAGVNAGGRIMVVLLLGGAGAALGALLLSRMLSHLRREGTLGL